MAMTRNQRFRRWDAPVAAAPGSLGEAAETGLAAEEGAFGFLNFKAPKINGEGEGSKFPPSPCALACLPRSSHV